MNVAISIHLLKKLQAFLQTTLQISSDILRSETRRRNRNSLRFLRAQESRKSRPSEDKATKMEGRGLDNANPTILSVSQLPSRQRKGGAARRGPDSKCDSIVYPRQLWPYGSSASSGEEDEEEDEEEPIDEQDIFGKRRHLEIYM